MAVVIAAGVARGRTVIEALSGSEPWRPRVLPAAAGSARVVLVQTVAGLLAGDEVKLSLVVGAGASLEVSELSAPLAHDGRGGPVARVGASLSVAVDGCLVWLGRPLIVAAGAHVERSVHAELEAGARLVLGDGIVAGRAGEPPGRLRARTRVVRDGRPVLDETLDTGPDAGFASPVVAGGARMVAGCLLAGARAEPAPRGAMQLHEPGTVWRGVGAPVDVARVASAVARQMVSAAKRSAHAGAPVPSRNGSVVNAPRSTTVTPAG
jgi:urease accessory protein